MVINIAIGTKSSARLLTESSSMLSNRSLARLSSSSKLTSPEDDVAGSAVSMRFDAQINQLTRPRATSSTTPSRSARPRTVS